MGKNSANWRHVTGASLAALFWGALAISLCVSFVSAIIGAQPAPLLAAVGSVLQLYIFSVLVGLPLVMLVGVPVFGLLRAKGYATYLTVGAIGLIPFTAAYLLGGRSFAYLFAVYGLPVALLAQFIANRAERSEHAP